MNSDTRIEILVVEDEEALRVGTCDLLAFHHYSPTGVETGEEAVKEALSGRYGLVLLDVMLPGISGFDVCKRIREELPRQAVLMLTAKGSEEDILEGFRSGADDYVTKPFSLAQLLARVEALLRRAGKLPPEERASFRFGSWEIDPAHKRARKGQHEIELTARELDLVLLLHQERDRIVSRRTLLQEVWGFGSVDDVKTRTVDVHVAKLRKKLGDGEHELIETLRGEGYRYRGDGTSS